MNDLSLPSPVARARDLAGLIAAEADAIEHGRRLTQPVLEELHEARVFRMLYPRSVGGDEVEPAVYIDAVGELARADGSVGWCVSIANSIGLFAPGSENAQGAKTVENPAGEHDVCQQLNERSARGEHRRPNRQQYDRRGRRAKSRAHLAESREENAVARHRVVQARRGQHESIRSAEDRNQHHGAENLS